MKKVLTLGLLLACTSLKAMLWKVGPTQTYTFCSQVAPLVQPGDTVDIDAATYVNDPQVIWSVNDLLIRGVGGRPRLEAGSIIANDMVNGKGIFVISGHNVTVDNIEFANCTVQDHNGAGIRQEGRNLHVIRCKFDGNEMGILAGNIANCTTLVEYSEFVNGGSPANPGYQHNIYINHIDTFIFRYNYSHNSIAQGHELKSRATNTIILYNRLANETSDDSRTIDVPNGGRLLVMGNVIEQGPNSANSNLLGYGLEGLSNTAPHAVYAVNNTFVNKKSTGSFIHVQAGTDTLLVKNNLFAGAKTGGLFIGTPAVLDSATNLINDTLSAFGFVNAASYDYHLTAASPALNIGSNITQYALGMQLKPVMMYKDTCNTETRPVAGTIDIGAFERAFPAGVLPEPGDAVVMVYPNPCSDQLMLRGKEGEVYGIFGSDGRCVRQGKITSEPVGTSTLAPGLYWIRMGGRACMFVKQ
jgi:hypothetical protein